MLSDLLKRPDSPLSEAMRQCLMEWLRESNNEDTRALRHAGAKWIEFLEGCVVRYDLALSDEEFDAIIDSQRRRLETEHGID